MSGTVGQMSTAFGAALRLVSSPAPTGTGWSPTATGMARCPCRPRWTASSPRCSGWTPGRSAASVPAGDTVAPPLTPTAPLTRRTRWRALPVPGRDHGAGRRSRSSSLAAATATADLAALLRRAGHAGPAGLLGRRGRRVQLARADPNDADVEVAPGRRRRSGAVAPGRGAEGLLRAEQRQRASSTRSPRPCTTPHADRDLDQLGAKRGRVVRRKVAPPWTPRWPTRRDPRHHDLPPPPATTAPPTTPPTTGAALRLPRVQPARAGLRRDTAGDRLGAPAGSSAEMVWNDGRGQRPGRRGGGGYSDVFPVPAWQASVVSAGASGGSAATRRRPTPSAGTPARRRPGAGYCTAAGACRTSQATPTRSPGTRSTPTARPRPSAGRARSPRCGRAWSGGWPRRPGQRFGLLQPLIYAGAWPRDTPAPGFNDVTSGNNGAFGADPRPGSGVAEDADRAPRCLNAVDQPDEPGAAGRIGSADTVVADRHDQDAVPHLGQDLHHGCPRVLGHVDQGLADNEVSGDLGSLGQPSLYPYIESDGHWGPAGQRLQRGAEPAQRQDGGMDAAGHLPGVPPESRRCRGPGGPVPVAARAVRAARLSARRAGRARATPAVAGPRRAGRARSGAWSDRSPPRSAPARRRGPRSAGRRRRWCRSFQASSWAQVPSKAPTSAR